MRRQYPLTARSVIDQQFHIHKANFEIEAGEIGRFVVEVRSGICEMELYEETPDDIRLFGVDPPLRLYTPPRRLRVELDALFEQMTVHRAPVRPQT